MPDANTAALPAVTVEFRWLDAEHSATALACRFTLNGIRHVVEGHVGNRGEDWGRLLPQSLVQRLTTAAGRGPGWSPSADDFQGLVDALAAAMQVSCRRPLLCLFTERQVGMARRGRMRPVKGGAAFLKVLLVLQCGAVVVVKIDSGPETGNGGMTGRFVTCYFARGRGWGEPRRAYATAVRRFVAQWARHVDRSGKPKLPDAQLNVRSQHDGVEVERKGFRFVTPEAWGFRPTADGGFVFWDVPAWK